MHHSAAPPELQPMEFGPMEHQTGFGYPDVELDETEDVALSLCEINTASWNSNYAPWAMSQRLGRAPATLNELCWGDAAARMEELGLVASAAVSAAASVAGGDAGEEVPLNAGMSYHEINSESCSSVGSGVGAAALNFCDVNTASWSSRDSRSPWFTLGAAAVRARSTDHAGEPHSHNEEGSLRGRRGSATASSLGEPSPSPKYAAALPPGAASRRSAARSVKDLLEDFAWFNSASASTEPASSSDAACRPGGSAAAGSSSDGDGGPGGGGGSAGVDRKPPPTLTRLEAGSIAALQAELAKELPGAPGHHHPRFGSHHSIAMMHPMWAKFVHEGRDHAHAREHHGHAREHHGVHANGHHAHAREHLSGGHHAHPGAHHGGHHPHLHPGHHSHAGGGHHSHAGREHHPHSSKHLWEPPPPLEQSSVAVHPVQFAFRVHSSKLMSKDRQVVSEMFHVRVGDATVPFRVRVIAKLVHKHKHGQCFRTARGRGRLELKCEGELPERADPVRFAFGIGHGQAAERRCTPIEHDFLGSSVGGLPHDAEDWDFRAATDPGSSACAITVDILPSRKPPATQPSPHAAHGDLLSDGLGAPAGDELGFPSDGHLTTIAEDAPANFV